jgi:hypothetical protein
MPSGTTAAPVRATCYAGVVRWLLFAVLAAGCGHAAASAVAWPKPYVAADTHDLGESLAPHLAGEVPELEASDDDTPAADATPATPITATPAAAPAAVQSAVAPSPEDPILTEDIVIEVDD